MYNAISRWAINRPKRVILFFVVLLLLMGTVGGGVFDKLKGGGFDDPKSESSTALKLLDKQFDTGPANVVLVLTSTNGGTVDGAQMTAAGNTLAQTLQGVQGIDANDTVSYWSTGSTSLASVDQQRGLILTRATGDEDAVNKTVERVHSAIKNAPPGVTVQVAGQGEFFNQLSTTIEDDLAKAESIALPITLILLVLIFAGFRAASLPLAVGIISIFGAFGVLFVLTQVTSVSIFALNLITALGLGLAIDYSLFIVSRFREELAQGSSVDDAIRTTVNHAGRSIAFSGLTVAVSLSALLIFPLYFLRSFAYAGIGVILVAMLTSLVLLPAVLKIMGNKLAPKAKAKAMGRKVDDNIWGRLAHKAMKRPGAVIVGVGLLLVLFGAPFLGISFGQPDDRVLPPGSEIRKVSDTLRTEFSSTESDAFPIVATSPATAADVTAYAVAVSKLPSIGRVDAVDGRYVDGVQVAPADPSLAKLGNGDEVWFNVVPKIEPISTQAETMIKEIRSVDTGFATKVAGQSAALVDSKEAIFSKIPLAAGIVALATFVLLFMMFGSILVPIKAIVLNVLSLTMTFGLMVWVFQEGHLSGFFNFTGTGLTDTSEPILMFCIAFGLSMDYEVFLLSRIKEEYDRTGNNEASVATGLARTGRIVTAAAVLLSVTFFAFATSGVTFIKMFGVGLGVAVLVDAFIIRATLVPALMKVAGKANWWAPRPLKAVYDRFGIKEAPSEPAVRPTPAFAAPPIAYRSTTVPAGAGRTRPSEGSIRDLPGTTTTTRPQPDDFDIELVAQSNGRSHK